MQPPSTGESDSFKHVNDLLTSRRVIRHMLGKDVVFELNGRPTGLDMYVGDDGRCLFRDSSWDSNGAVPELASLAKVPMRDGRNAMDFRIGDSIVASAALFHWNSSDWMIIVDIDGTITQTDVGGIVTTSELGQQILGQQLGLHHAHADVCEAMSLLACAGYRLVFLTARPITRSHATRRYLASIGRAGGGVPMPEGALLASTKGTLGTMASVWADVKSYKLSALREVQSLFSPPGSRAAAASPPASGPPAESNFAGGFGNHDYDSAAYLDAGCPPERIFQIDEDSNIEIPGTGVVYKGYTTLIPALPDLFPPVVVVQWERQKTVASGGPASGMSFTGSFRSSPVAPPSSGGSSGGGGGAGSRQKPLSYNKIPGVALLGEGLGKVWDGVQQIPGVRSVSKVDLYGGLSTPTPPSTAGSNSAGGATAGGGFGSGGFGGDSVSGDRAGGTTQSVSGNRAAGGTAQSVSGNRAAGGTAQSMSGDRTAGAAQSVSGDRAAGAAQAVNGDRGGGGFKGWGVDVFAQGNGAGRGGSVSNSNSVGGGVGGGFDGPPPSYGSAEGQGLIDLGVHSAGPP